MNSFCESILWSLAPLCKGDCNAVCNPRCCQKICTCGFHEDDERFIDDNRPPPVSQSGASAQGGTYEAKQMHPPPQAQA